MSPCHVRVYHAHSQQSIAPNVAACQRPASHSLQIAMNLLLATLALAARKDHEPVDCPNVGCENSIKSMMEGTGLGGADMKCTTCTEGKITCGMWKAPNWQGTALGDIVSAADPPAAALQPASECLPTARLSAARRSACRCPASASSTLSTRRGTHSAWRGSTRRGKPAHARHAAIVRHHHHRPC